MKSRPKALIYSRVSTSDKGQNPEVQCSELRRFVLAREWDLYDSIVDHGFSGGTDKRPGLKWLLELVRSRKVDIVIVTKLDRLARSLRHLVSLLDEFTALGVQFISIKDQIDMTTAGGRLMLHIIGAFAEFERNLIRERTLAGLAYAKSQGKILGRPKMRDDEAINALKLEGLSQSAIQKRLGVSKGAIWRALSAPKSPLKSARKTK